MEKEEDNLYVEQEGNEVEGVKTKKKRKMSEEHVSELDSHSLVLALPVTEDKERNLSVKKDRKKKKIVDVVENVIEETVSEKKNKKKKVGSDATENVAEKIKPDSQMTESCKENKMKRKKKKRHSSPENKDLNKNAMEGGLPTADNDNNEAISEHNKIKKRKKKKSLVSGSVDIDQKELDEAMREVMLKVKPGSSEKTEEDHMEEDTERKLIKRKKKKRHDLVECTNDTKPVEDVQEAVENHENVNVKQKKVKKKSKKKQLSSSENSDGNQNQLKSELEVTASNTPGNALLTSEDHDEMKAAKKRKIKKKEHDGRHQKMLKEGSPEFQLPVESDLKDSQLMDEYPASKMKDNSTVCKDKASDASARDFSTKQLVDKSEGSSSELQREVKQCPAIAGEIKETSVTDCKKEKELCSASIGDTKKDGCLQDGTNKECISTEVVLDLPKRVTVSCTRKKLLILDLNGLLLDVVMVFSSGYTPDKKIGLKSAFKRPFCDDFLNFCFERFEVGVWTSRTKRNMNDVIDFLMADSKHKLLFCWDQSHCTTTGFNTIDNRHKPLVCKELRKLWDKHEPTLPWEKGEYNESNTLLLDDSPYKALLNPPNTAIFPKSYSYKDKNDNSLGPGGDVQLYLEGLAMAEHVQEYVMQHPFGQHAITSKSASWKFYCKILDRFNLQHD